MSSLSISSDLSCVIWFNSTSNPLEYLLVSKKTEKFLLINLENDMKSSNFFLLMTAFNSKIFFIGLNEIISKTIVLLSGFKSIINFCIFVYESLSLYSINNCRLTASNDSTFSCSDISKPIIFLYSSFWYSKFISSHIILDEFNILSKIIRADVFPQLFLPMTNDNPSLKSNSKFFNNLKFFTFIFFKIIFHSPF